MKFFFLKISLVRSFLGSIEAKISINVYEGKKSGRFVTGTCYSRKHGEPCRFNIGRRKKEKQLGSVSSLCVPCNNSLLNPRCPSVRPYGTTTRRFKTKHTLHDTDYNDTIHRGTRTHTYMVHTRALSLPIQTLHIYYARA